MSGKIYKMSDRIPVKFGDVVVYFGILNKDQKAHINSCTEIIDGMREVNVTDATWYSVKYGVKSIKGVEYASGGEFELQFEEDKMSLTDDCVNELLTMDIRDNLYVAALQFKNGPPDKVVHPITRKELKGVKILPVEAGITSGN